MSSPTSAAPIVLIPATGNYRIDPARSTISFTTRHFFGLAAVHGTFALREGDIHVVDPVEGSTARARISAASIDTGNPSRDATVRSAGYLDVERHPDFVFTTTAVERGEPWLLHGSLTVCGTTRPIEVRIVSSTVAGGRITLHAESEVDRHEFGVTKMKGIIARQLTLRLDLIANRV